MKNRVKKRNSQWLKIGIVILLLGILVFRYHNYLLEGIREIARIPLSEKTGIILASAGYMLAEGQIISRLAKIFHADVQWKKGIGCAYYCSFVRVATFGGGAGAAEIYYLSEEGMEPAHGLDVSLIQYLCQKVVATCGGAAGLLICFGAVEASAGKYRIYLVYGVMLAIIVIAAILAVLLSPKIAGLLFKLLDWLGEKKRNWKSRTEAWKDQVAAGQQGVKTVFHEKGKLAEIVLLNILKYICWFSIPYILYGGSGDISLTMSIGLMAVATVMATVIPAPAGYGSLEFMQLVLFEPLLGKSRTVSLMILYRAATTFIPAIAGGAVVCLDKRKKKGADQH